MFAMSRTLTTVLRAGTLSVFAVLAAGAAPTPNASKPLQIYFVDVEGGQSTLFVTPEGKSLLIDTGWAGYNGRDANRIVAAAKDAKVRKIDFLLATHYHRDHAGGFPQLVERIPIEQLMDHGQNREPSEPNTEQTFQEYVKAAEKKHVPRMTLKAGDELPIPGLHAKVVSADGLLIDEALPGAGQENTACAATEKRPDDTTENGHSLGVLFTFGKLKIADLGDLTWDKELQLVCPKNKIGSVDIYIVSHHGSESSGSPALVHGMAPRVAIMDNGAKKGGTPAAWDIIEKSPGLEDLWQLHFSENGQARNVAAPFIANLSGEPDPGNYLKLTAWTDGHFEIFNSRTKASKSYRPR
jgi:beta-lactamase superfamily II metal-dependent hydrolase